MPWNWKINLHCFFCQREEYENDNIPLGKNPLKPCDTIMVEKEGKLTAVLICEECYKKEVAE